MKKLQLKYNSERKVINDFEKILVNINKVFNLPEEKFINLQIAVSEALLNAIVHGNKENPIKKVHVSVEYNDSKMVISIKDEGTGFNIDSLPDPTKGENLFKEHGRGIFIIKSLVDIFDCFSDTSGTEIRITMFK